MVGWLRAREEGVDFWRTKLLRDGLTWVIAALAMTYGGIEMANLRPAKRAEFGLPPEDTRVGSSRSWASGKGRRCW
jgi:hypothetical protein